MSRVPSTVGRVTRRPLGPLLAVLIASALGCYVGHAARRRPRAPRRAATYPAPTFSPAPVAAGPRGAPRPARRGRRCAAAPDLPGAYRFISAPDFLNQDVADLTADGRTQHLDPTHGRGRQLHQRGVRRRARARDERDGVARHPRRARRRRPRRGALGPRRLPHRRLRAGAHRGAAAARLARGRRRSTTRPGASGSPTTACVRSPRSATTRSATTRGRRPATPGSTSSGATCRSSSGSSPTRCWRGASGRPALHRAARRRVPRGARRTPSGSTTTSCS